MLPLHPNAFDGYRLFHEGLLALADVEHNGIPIDVDYCEKQYNLLQRKIDRIKKNLEKKDEVKYWKKKFGSKYNLDSNEQLAHVLFEYLGHEPKTLTAKGKPSTSQESLEQIDIDLVKEWALLGKYQKTRNTYIKNFLLEQTDGILSPFFNLHTVTTFRSSSSAINFQNIPTRIEFIKKIIRRAIKAPEDYLIIEIDFSGIEVSIAACYNQDPVLIADIVDPKRDMHRDMVKECYKLADDEWTKACRSIGKNKFVFPQFYGDYYVNCATGLWDAISILNLTTKQGTPLKKHLKSHGINDYTKFENHIKEVEDYFWNERFKVYQAWKDQHWEDYQSKGYVDLKTGFRCSGFMKRNEAINYPIQGSAFHCLLWCLIQLNKWLKEKEKKSKIIGQIHDSIVSLVHKDELNVFLKKAYRIMEKNIMRHWPWIIVPLKVETEASPLNGSWYLKKEIHKHNCDKCNSNWMYQHSLESSTIWECPICYNKQEEING